ncbi:MAG: hypothetical protein IKB96_00895 [Prevotella sp.]|nr:hypothetical protein [Prevotella sp.]
MWKENCKIAYKFKSTNEWLVVPKEGYTVDGKKVAVVSDGFELKCDHNPYHDKKGRFTSSTGVTAGDSSVVKIENAIRNKKTEVLVVFDKDGNEVFRKEGTGNKVTLNDEERAKMLNAIVTHNHPNNSRLSDEDISTFVRLKMNEIRVITPDGLTCSLKKNEGERQRGKDLFTDYFKLTSTHENEMSDFLVKRAERDGFDPMDEKVWTDDYYEKLRREFSANWLSDNANKYGYTYNEDVKRQIKHLPENTHNDSPTSDLATKHGANWKTINGAKVLVGKGGSIIAGMGGKFDKVPTSGGWAKQCAEEKARVLAMKPNRQALYVLDNDGQTDEVCLEAMKQGKTKELVEAYFTKMEANGDPAPTKSVAGQYYPKADIDSGKYKNYIDAQRGHISKITGQTKAEAEVTLRELDNWTGGSGFRADQKVLDAFVEKAPAYKGKIYRGMSFRDEAEYEAFMKNVGDGRVIKMNGSASWSDNQTVARRFAHAGDDYLNSVMITCVKNKTSAPIDFANHEMEGEVLSHSRARWTVLHHEVYDTRAGAKKAYLTVIEKSEYADD